MAGVRTTVSIQVREIHIVRVTLDTSSILKGNRVLLLTTALVQMVAVVKIVLI